MNDTNQNAPSSSAFEKLTKSIYAITEKLTTDDQQNKSQELTGAVKGLTSVLEDFISETRDLKRSIASIEHMHRSQMEMSQQLGIGMQMLSQSQFLNPMQFSQSQQLSSKSMTESGLLYQSPPQPQYPPGPPWNQQYVYAQPYGRPFGPHIYNSPPSTVGSIGSHSYISPTYPPQQSQTQPLTPGQLSNNQLNSNQPPPLHHMSSINSPSTQPLINRSASSSQPSRTGTNQATNSQVSLPLYEKPPIGVNKLTSSLQISRTQQDSQSSENPKELLNRNRYDPSPSRSSMSQSIGGQSLTNASLNSLTSQNTTTLKSPPSELFLSTSTKGNDFLQGSTTNHSDQDGDLMRSAHNLLTDGDPYGEPTTEELLEILSNKGFKNHTFNKVLLQMHKNDLKQVLQSLEQYYKNKS